VSELAEVIEERSGRDFRSGTLAQMGLSWANKGALLFGNMAKYRLRGGSGHSSISL
jgi:hypothetical protein